MSVIEGVLKEEAERLESNIKSYKRKLASLPRGSIYIQSINGNKFAYLKKKVDGKVISKYIGKENSEIVLKAQQDAFEYRRIKKNISIAIKELNKLKKACKVYE